MGFYVAAYSVSAPTEKTVYGDRIGMRLLNWERKRGRRHSLPSFTPRTMSHWLLDWRPPLPNSLPNRTGYWQLNRPLGKGALFHKGLSRRDLRSLKGREAHRLSCQKDQSRGFLGTYLAINSKSLRFSAAALGASTHLLIRRTDGLRGELIVVRRWHRESAFRYVTMSCGDPGLAGARGIIRHRSEHPGALANYSLSLQLSRCGFASCDFSPSGEKIGCLGRMFAVLCCAKHRHQRHLGSAGASPSRRQAPMRFKCCCALFRVVKDRGEPTARAQPPDLVEIIPLYM